MDRAQPSNPKPSTRGLRQGPRPLPLHLGQLTLTTLSSLPALALWNNGSLPWKPHLAPRAEALRHALAGVAPEAFAAAVERAGRARLNRFMAGVQRYRRHADRRDLADPPVIWREGSIRLLDYGATAPDLKPDAPVLLVVPSLVNRAYVLDLSPERSLLRHMAAQGLRPLLVDWGRPGAAEQGFTLTDYIAGPLEAAFDHALERGGGRPVTVIGYCMGGLLALALGQRRERDVAGLALLATPWNFHADQPIARRVAAAAPGLLAAIDRMGMMPVDGLQMLFAGLDPTLVLKKFDALSRLPESSPKLHAFVELEDWLNDGIALAGPVARECIAGWYAGNTPGAGRWRVAGRVVNPKRFTRPALVVIPAEDRIVPPESALALARALPNAEVMQPPLGHIGMVVSKAAPQAMWAGLVDWCRRIAV